MAINFDMTKVECVLIRRIVDRAHRDTLIGNHQDRLSTVMDLAAINNAIGLDLAPSARTTDRLCSRHLRHSRQPRSHYRQHGLLHAALCARSPHLVLTMRNFAASPLVVAPGVMRLVRGVFQEAK